MAKKLDDGRIQTRVRITGTYRGLPFEYVDPEDDDGTQYIWPDGDPSAFWWREGNMSCDCNRDRFIEKLLAEHPELPEPERCGETINIDRIEPLEPGLPVLELNESSDGHA